MANRLKTGRRASQEERDAAGEWVKAYRSAEQAADGRHCLNPEDQAHERTYISFDDPEPLLLALEDFALNGTFQPVEPSWIIRLIIRAEFERLVLEGTKSAVAKLELSEKFRCSLREIQRITLAAKKSG